MNWRAGVGEHVTAGVKSFKAVVTAHLPTPIIAFTVQPRSPLSDRRTHIQPNANTAREVTPVARRLSLAAASRPRNLGRKDPIKIIGPNVMPAEMSGNMPSRNAGSIRGCEETRAWSWEFNSDCLLGDFGLTQRAL